MSRNEPGWREAKPGEASGILFGGNGPGSPSQNDSVLSSFLMEIPYGDAAVPTEPHRRLSSRAIPARYLGERALEVARRAGRRCREVVGAGKERPAPGHTIVAFYPHTTCPEPGFCGWAVVV